MATSVCLTSQVTYLVDFVKIFISSFLGAGLAFLVNYKSQENTRSRNNLAAGNIAITIISRQFGDFMILRAGLKNELIQSKDLPDWLQVKPSIFKMSEDMKFDVGSLAFLLERGNHELFSKIILAETKYQELRHILEMATETFEQRDQLIAKAGFKDYSLTDLRKLENAVDSALRVKCAFLNNSMQKRINEDLKAYQTAGQELHNLMTKIYNAKKVIEFTAMGANQNALSVKF